MLEMAAHENAQPESIPGKVRIDGVSMSPHSRNDDIMQANVYSWHILNPSVRSQTESHPLPSSSSSSLATDISPTGAMGSPYTPSSRRNNYIAGKANDTNPFTASTNYSPPYCSRKEGADATNHLTLKGEGGGKVQRVPVIYEAIQGIPSTKYTLDDILPSINIMVDPERRNSIPLSEQCEIVHVLEDLALSLDFHQELTRINHQILKICDNMTAIDMERSGEVYSIYDPNDLFYTLLENALASRTSYGRQFCQSYDSLQSSSIDLIEYRLHTLRFALTLLEEQSIFAMSVFFRSYNSGDPNTSINDKEHLDSRSKDLSLNNNLDIISSKMGGSGVGAGIGSIERSSSGGSAPSGNYTILLKLLNSWLRDIRHLDSVKPEIAEGSIDHKIVMCARTTAKIFMKIIVLIRPCCFNYLRVLGCQHNFENILHRVQNDWMHRSLLVHKEELLVALHLAYDNA